MWQRANRLHCSRIWLLQFRFFSYRLFTVIGNRMVPVLKNFLITELAKTDVTYSAVIVISILICSAVRTRIFSYSITSWWSDIYGVHYLAKKTSFSLIKAPSPISVSIGDGNQWKKRWCLIAGDQDPIYTSWSCVQEALLSGTKSALQQWSECLQKQRSAIKIDSFFTVENERPFCYFKEFTLCLITCIITIL